MKKFSDMLPTHAISSLAAATAAMLLVMLVGTFGYRYIGGEQYSLMDCFYMTFITVTTIGYGEIIDLSDNPAGRMFTVFIAISGIGTLTYTLSAVTAFIVEGDINRDWQKKKMQNKIGKLTDHYIVCGVGRVGSNVVNELAATGRPFVVVDMNMQHIEDYLPRQPGMLYLHGDATDNETLLAAGITRARGLFAVAPEDTQNLVISLSARQLNPALRIVARCHDMKNEGKTRRAGADEIVSPDFTGGLRIVSAMLRPHVVSFLDEMIKSDDSMRMEEIVVPAGFSGELLAIFNETTRDCILLAIWREEKWMFNPNMKHKVCEGDVLMVMSTPHGHQSLEKLMRVAA